MSRNRRAARTRPSCWGVVFSVSGAPPRGSSPTKSRAKSLGACQTRVKARGKVVVLLPELLPLYCPSCGSFVQRCCSIDLDQGAVDPLLDRLSVRCAVRPVTPSVGARGSSGGADGAAAVRHDGRVVLDACCTALAAGHGRPERRGQRAVTTESDASSETQLSTPNRGARGCCTGHSLLAGGGPFGSCGRSAGFGLRRTSRARDPPRTARMAALRWTGGTLAALAALSGAHAQVCAATTPVPLGRPPPTLPQLPPHILSVAPRARAARCAKRYAHCGPRCAAVRRFATTATRTAAVC